MKITKVTVSAARTFNHPTERFANFRFEMRIEAEILPGDGYRESLAELKQAVENEAEGHKLEILAELATQRQRVELQGQVAYARNTAPKCLAEDRLELAAHLELQEADDSTSRRWNIDNLQKRIAYTEERIARLPALEAELAALPAPRLLPLPELHPGHPDHPDTNDDRDEYNGPC